MTEMIELDEEILKDFLVESKENIEQLDEKFVELEQDPTDKELLSAIFRIMHTLKGTSGFFGFTTLQAISHAAEDILAKLRDGVVSADQQIIDILLKATDYIKAIVAYIEENKKEPDDNLYKDFIKTVREFADNLGKESPKGEKEEQTQNKEGSEEKSKEKLEEKEEIDKKESQDQPQQPQVQSQPQKQDQKSPPVVHLTDTHIKVDIGLLDKLMNLAGELVLSRNRLVQIANSLNDPEVISATQRLSLVTTELQEEIMKTRMQPIGTVFNKFPRVVRDLARIANKKVKLNIEGTDTELDRSIIEAIKDPLTHIVRNSVDHGIEPPEERVKVGKPAVGQLLLKAYHEGGQVIIEIKDDGKGIDVEKIKKKAIEKGLITELEANSMSDREAINLIFKPGFSTAEKVTNISGRGVGMDVVKTNIEKLGGSIDIQTEKGRGTTIIMKIPLTLAIIPALIVSCHNQRYAIPQVNLKELVILSNKEEIERDVQVIGDSKFYRLRNEVIPLFYLEDILELSEQNTKDKMSIIILDSGSLEFGLVVDKILDSEEIVVKPLGKHFQGIPVYAGATLMGDGGIALILDVVGISSVLDIKKGEAESITHETRKITSKGDEQFFLIFQVSEDAEYFAIPLALVARLDKIKAKDIEFVAGKEVIQYRGYSMPLIRLDQFMPIKPLADKEEYNIIVFNTGGRDIAFLASHIVDSIHAYFELDEELYDFEGVLGSAIIREHTTLFVDVFKVIEMYSPDWFKKYFSTKPYEILLAEDSVFYRNLISSYLSSFGYSVVTAKNGKDAWDKLQQHEFDLLLTDIVMPEMDGFELSFKIRQDERLKYMPIIAISSEDIKKGNDSGIDRFVPKLKLERLAGVIEEALQKRLKKAA